MRIVMQQGENEGTRCMASAIFHYPLILHITEYRGAT